MNKRGSAGEWILILIIILGVGATATFISYSLSDSKIQAISDKLGSKADKPGCKLVEIDFQRDAGKNDIQICNALNKEPVLRIVYKDVNIYKGSPGAVAVTDFCSSERLVSSQSITEATRTNIGVEIQNDHEESGWCYAKDPSNGIAEKITINELNILCC